MPPADLFPFLLPLCLVAAGGLLCLGLEAFLPRASKHRLLPWLAALAVVAAGIAQALNNGDGHVHGMFAMDGARAWLCLAILAATAISLGGLQQTLERDDYPGGEPYALTMFAAVGTMLMVMANDAIALFMGLELASLSIYALVGLRRHRLDANEALFKYFAMGAVFSAIFLYGIALTYGATGFTAFGHAPLGERQGLFILGQSLMVIGLLFKVGAVPFHFWSPDAYTGAPVAVTGFMGAVIKVGGFAALGALWLNLLAITGGIEIASPLALNATLVLPAESLDAPHLHKFHLVFLVSAVLSLLLGNFSALRQTSARRMIAFSSVAHAGYMLLAFALPAIAADGSCTIQLASLWYYLVAYAITTAGALTAIAALSGRDDAADDLAGLSGRGRAKPLHGAVLTVFMASFAGVPPTAGFLGKYLVLSDLVAKEQIWLAIIAMLVAVVGAAYYLRLVITVWSAPAGDHDEVAEPTPGLSAWGLSLAALAVVALIAAPMLMSPTKPAASAPTTTAAIQP